MKTCVWAECGDARAILCFGGGGSGNGTRPYPKPNFESLTVAGK